jgi:nitric oxide reductase large subunit
MSDELSKQPALRRWQESVYGKGPYQVPDYESMAAIVQEHEQMADRIEELEAKAMKASNAALLEKRRADKAEAKLEELLVVAKRAVRLSLDYGDFKLYAMEPMHQAIAAAELTGEDWG